MDYEYVKVCGPDQVTLDVVSLGDCWALVEGV